MKRPLLLLMLLAGANVYGAASESRYRRSKIIRPSRSDAVEDKSTTPTPPVSPKDRRSSRDAGLGLPRSKSAPEKLGKGMMLPHEVSEAIASKSSPPHLSPLRTALSSGGSSPLARVASLTNFEEKMKGQVLDEDQQHLAKAVREGLQKSKSEVELIEGLPIAASSVKE